MCLGIGSKKKSRTNRRSDEEDQPPRRPGCSRGRGQRPQGDQGVSTDDLSYRSQPRPHVPPPPAAHLRSTSDPRRTTPANLGKLQQRGAAGQESGGAEPQSQIHGRGGQHEGVQVASPAPRKAVRDPNPDKRTSGIPHSHPSTRFGPKAPQDDNDDNNSVIDNEPQEGLRKDLRKTYGGLADVTTYPSISPSTSSPEPYGSRNRDSDTLPRPASQRGYPYDPRTGPITTSGSSSHPHGTLSPPASQTYGEDCSSEGSSCPGSIAGSIIEPRPPTQDSSAPIGTAWTHDSRVRSRQRHY